MDACRQTDRQTDIDHTLCLDIQCDKNLRSLQSVWENRQIVVMHVSLSLHGLADQFCSFLMILYS